MVAVGALAAAASAPAGDADVLTFVDPFIESGGAGFGAGGIALVKDIPSLQPPPLAPTSALFSIVRATIHLSELNGVPRSVRGWMGVAYPRQLRGGRECR